MIRLRKIKSSDKETLSLIESWEIQEWGRDLSTTDHHVVIGAFDGSVLIGCALLVKDDLPIRTNLSPWLASVYVLPDYRKKGLATDLVNAVISEAINLGFPEIWLFTSNTTTLYVRLGWKWVETAMYNGKPITILCKKL